MKNLYQKIKKAAYTVLGKSSHVSAVILAGGSGTRVGGTATKQMLPVCGVPLIVHTLRAFEASEYIHEIVVVARKDEIPAYEGFRETYGLTKLKKVVEGGATRQISAKNGFDAIDAKAAYVVIHDGARALITPEQIKAVVLSALAHGSAIAACPATDTIKYSENGVTVSETLPREHIWLAQTPQVFKDEIYRAAAYTAEKDGFAATDDASMVENIGIRVAIVNCGPDNFKVTYQSDLERAERILRERGETT